MAYWVIFIACGLALSGYAVMAARRGDYRNRWFYRKLYSANIFDLIVFGWKLLGAPGSWVFTRTIALGYALSHPSTMAAVRSNLDFQSQKGRLFQCVQIICQPSRVHFHIWPIRFGRTGNFEGFVGRKIRV